MRPTVTSKDRRVVSHYLRKQLCRSLVKANYSLVTVGIGAELCLALVEAGMIVCGMSKRKDKMEVG